ncbi:SMODS domain-containing nucleotidyltransferase [Rhodococcus rhodochrous]|uniref:SMODS domain-containing nucleotidyltransferase n=1 Tax=Rhodococcus rhodochrous TaxID=1829 RepID=UPI001781E4EC|nr:nucleotidyltransferase [Rhodococcus rhodochrous]QOH59674.1 nucleotidyltransferase [Rhodococcus rhodochrous]
MAVLTSNFDTALRRIQPSEADRNNAPKAHEDVRGVLTSAESLKEWGLSPILIGSYKRRVAIQRVYDVDVFCRMDDISVDVEPSEVLDRFFTVLDDRYGTDGAGKRRVRRQARSLQVAFPEFDGLYVDAVPARKRGDGTWEIPERNEQDWQQTNPDELTSLTNAMNEQLTELYVPTVKLLRQTRRTILKSRPGGLFVEMAFYDACLRGVVDSTNQTLCYVTGLEALAQYLSDKVSWGAALPDPTLPGQTLTFRATDLQWEEASEKFAAAAEKARAAYDGEDRCEAAVKFRSLLGGNDDYDYVFPLPADCNDDGSKKATASLIAPGERRIPAGDRRFG